MKTFGIICVCLATLGFGGLKAAQSMAGSQPLPNCPGNAFAKQARVFDAVTVCATDGVSQEKLTHAANVLAEWMDNDNNGFVDDALVYDALKSGEPYLVMTEESIGILEMASMLFTLTTRVSQDLGAYETKPGGGERDASQEEIHHLMFNAGWSVAYPEVFSDKPGSILYKEWENAEAAGDYNYDDDTCYHSCKVSEFFYLATAAYFGSDADLQSDEMRLKNRDMLAKSLPETVAVMQSDQYSYPLNHWPTGEYAHPERISYSTK